ncbi:unnamed protein product, partial [Staurois parvus]
MERQVSRALRRSGGRRPPGGATGLGPSGGAAGAGPPGGTTGLGPSGGAAGAGPPDWSDRSRALRRSGGHRVTRHNRGLRVNWDDRWHWVRHWIVWLDSGHRVTRHQVIWLDSGHRVIWQGSGLRVNRHNSEHRVIRYDSGHWVTRHQVIWLDSGHRIRYRIIWINSGHRVNW